ncbi:Uncharacterised protein [Mesomycoplasma dispar]|uniref:Uncharacterized protein n=1 Tax=Mesomycoplasma dispar TaxID=86660 RepID=A0AAJ5TCE3_9BACT|nr:hypothetical protein [Mesomycoplasma dispar]AJR12510.1 hypothetical protein MDIS_00410 [Mesomycoplasma dispar]ATP59433.1 hypothetical protein CSW10_00410 [Mesomycoplasma dispar]VEU61235.1 Uncharacterised protein [Mesomycoplasma dispar]
MLKFFNNLNNIVELKTNIKIIETENTDLFLADLFKYEYEAGAKVFELNSKTISIKDVILISNLTKFSDFFSLSTKNWLGDSIINNEYWAESLFFRNENIDKIVANINEKLGFPFLNYEIDNTKLIKAVFSVETDILINQHNFENLINIIFSTMKHTLIILKDLDYIKLDKLFKYSSLTFLILTNDFTKYISKFSELELISFYSNKTVVDVIDNLPIIRYFENIKNSPIDENELIYNSEEEKLVAKLDFYKIKTSFFK